MLRLMRLQQAAADGGVAAGAADDLMQKLEGALGGARIAVGEAEIGVDYADQVEHREVMAFRHQLRADDDVEQTVRYVGEFLAHALDGSDKIGRQHQDARSGKQHARFFLEPLDARPNRDIGVDRLAFRTMLRMRHGEATMMTDELFAEAV